MCLPTIFHASLLNHNDVNSQHACLWHFAFCKTVHCELNSLSAGSIPHYLSSQNTSLSVCTICEAMDFIKLLSLCLPACASILCSILFEFIYTISISNKHYSYFS
uniref:Uncharacterized protein n=1 Tax=Triticum urartu TaxID=4572 RepID=A0A8R7TC40_TRIUA